MATVNIRDCLTSLFIAHKPNVRAETCNLEEKSAKELFGPQKNKFIKLRI